MPLAIPPGGSFFETPRDLDPVGATAPLMKLILSCVHKIQEPSNDVQKVVHRNAD
jgi:hypothetical protein